MSNHSASYFTDRLIELHDHATCALRARKYLLGQPKTDDNDKQLATFNAIYIAVNTEIEKLHFSFFNKHLKSNTNGKG